LQPRAPRVRGRVSGQGAAVRGRAGPPARPVGALRTGVISSEPMGLTFKKLHPVFVGEASPIELRSVHDPETLAAIRAGMDEYAILVFHDQRFTDDEQLAFAQRLDGALHTKLGSAAIQKNRFGNEALGDISNLGADGEILKSDDRRRAYSLGNRLWHTDASFQDPPGRYSMLHAKVIPPAGADTEYADMRAAWDALPAATKAQIDGLRVHHSIAYSRQTLGFDFSKDEAEALKGAITRWCERSRARAAAPSMWPPTPRGSSTGPCPRAG